MPRAFFLTTQRLGFSRWSPEDLPLALSLWTNPEVTRFTGGPFSPEYCRERLDREMATMALEGAQYWPLFLLATDEFAGCCGVRPYRPAERIFEFGFHFLPHHWGKGLATEAGKSAIAYAFESLGAKGLFAGHHPQNVGSRRALEKLGFRYTHDRFYPPTGLIHPSYLLNRPAEV